ncbi:MAG TPA: tetratricopeptide repeat protein, partial [Longimicrobiales bacterium]
PIPAADVAGWRHDLQQLVRELERKHPAPYNRTPRDTFTAAVARLEQRIPQLAAHEIIVELQRLVALVGDGHTNINLTAAAGVDFHQLPIRFGMYPDGVFVEAGDIAYRNAVGGRVVAIDDTPIDTVLARIRPLLSRDNDQWFPVATPQLMNLVEVLHALRIAKDLEDVTLRIERAGRTADVVIKPLAQTRPRAFGYPFRAQYTSTWLDARDAAGGEPPLYQQRTGDVYWWQYVAKDRLLYIKWDEVQNRAQGETALQMFRTALAYAREHASEIDKVLLDIRNNIGGEGGLLDPIVREIVRTREVDEPGRFFVAIGPRTFSAALLLSSALERYARPIFVGEPTGGKVNVYAGHVFATLGFSGIGVSISPALYQTSFPNDARAYVTPRLYVRPTFADYLANRDPVYEAVVAYKPPTYAQDVERLVLAGDTVGAASLLRRHAADPVNTFNGAAPLINAAGYRQLRAGNAEVALRLFRLNVRVHPDYTNGWDSLGEAYAETGRRAEAIAAFEEVLRREPGNGRARELLERLRRS